MSDEAEKIEIHRGLKGVYFERSGLSVIDVRALDDPVLGPRDGDGLPAVCM